MDLHQIIDDVLLDIDRNLDLIFAMKNQLEKLETELTKIERKLIEIYKDLEEKQ